MQIQVMGKMPRAHLADIAPQALFGHHNFINIGVAGQHLGKLGFDQQGNVALGPFGF